MPGSSDKPVLLWLPNPLNCLRPRQVFRLQSRYDRKQGTRLLLGNQTNRKLV